MDDSPAVESAIDRLTADSQQLHRDLAAHYSHLQLLCMWLGEHPLLQRPPVSAVIRLGFLVTGDSRDDQWQTVADLAEAEQRASEQAALARRTLDALPAHAADLRAAAAAGLMTVAGAEGLGRQVLRSRDTFVTQVGRFYLALCEQPWARSFLSVLEQPWVSADLVARFPQAGPTAASAIEFLVEYAGGRQMPPRDLYLSGLSRTEPSLNNGDRVAYDAVLEAGQVLHKAGRL